MTPRKIKETQEGGPKRASLQTYMDTLEKDGKVEIPCPHGMGYYIIRLYGSFWYDTPEITWVNDEEKNPGYGRNYAPQFVRTNEGRCIPWYPRGLGHPGFMAFHRTGFRRTTTHEQFLHMAKMVIGYIITGRRLWKMTCGQNINSLNDDDTLTDDWY